MTALMTKTIKKITSLPQEEQDSFAEFILEELVDQQQWNTSFKKSQDTLSLLADEANEEYKAEKTTLLDFSSISA